MHSVAPCRPFIFKIRAICHHEPSIVQVLETIDIRPPEIPIPLPVVPPPEIPILKYLQPFLVLVNFLGQISFEI